MQSSYKLQSDPPPNRQETWQPLLVELPREIFESQRADSWHHFRCSDNMQLTCQYLIAIHLCRPSKRAKSKASLSVLFCSTGWLHLSFTPKTQRLSTLPTLPGFASRCKFIHVVGILHPNANHFERSKFFCYGLRGQPLWKFAFWLLI